MLNEDNNRGDLTKSSTTRKTTNSNTSDVLVVYYSVTNNTKQLAVKIAEYFNTDTFEVVPVNLYTSDDLNYNDSSSRVSKEHENLDLRNIELKNTKVENWDKYKTVFIGYPIWWGIAAWPINNFIKENDFTGKTVIPFCTSASSPLGSSVDELKSLTDTGTWMEGERFSSNVNDEQVKEWLKELNIK